jgi:FAD dependent oxidoreductase
VNKYTLSQRNLPLDDSWDVIVVGGGPAGCTAAAAAGREGARTLLIEGTGALGGMGTSGGVPAWCPFTDMERIIYSGLAERVLKECMAGMPHVPADKFDWTPIDGELLKRIYDQLLAENGVTVLFNSFLTGVECQEPGSVSALLVASKNGLTAFKAKIYIDCSGDGDLAVWAGAEYEKGDQSGDLQPASHCFVLSNVNTEAFQGGCRFTKEVLGKMLKTGRYQRLEGSHACNNLIGPGTVGFNVGHLWDVDNTKPESVSRALKTGRELAVKFQEALAEFLPAAFKDAHLVLTAPLMGIRETRRIIGDYLLTIDDYLARRSFADEICRNSYPVDVHISKNEIEASSKGQVSGMSRFEHYGKGETHGIPYRCLTPKNISNVLIAGRSISTDRPVQGSTRVMPVCLCMGEAAGIAAAMTARADCLDVHAVDTDELRLRLQGYGGYLPENNDN